MQMCPVQVSGISVHCIIRMLKICNTKDCLCFALFCPDNVNANALISCGISIFSLLPRDYSSVCAASGGGGAMLGSPWFSLPPGTPETAAGEPAEGEGGGSAEGEGEASRGAGERGAETGGEQSAPRPPTAS